MRIGFAISLVLLGICSSAQNIYIEVSKDEVSVNESFTYSIIAHKKCEIIAPDFESFKVFGPNYSESYQSNNYGGSMQSQQTFTYTYTLKPTAAGIYTIKSAKLQCGKKAGGESSEEVKITVTTGSQSTVEKAGVAEFYLTLESSNSSVMQGEAFTLSLKFYSRKQPSSIEGYENGIADGLWRQDLRKPEDPYEMSRENIKGTSYYVVELRKELCIPLRAGKISIGPSYASLVFQEDIFNQYRQDGHSNGLEIEVLTLPKDKPDDFNGLVGSFELNDNVDRQRVSAGQAVEVNISITGYGNLNAFDPPKMELPPSFKWQEPTYKEELKNTSRGVEGTVEYTFSFTPTIEGEYRIEPYHFSYYDLPAGEIKHKTTKELLIAVDPREGGGVLVEKAGSNEISSQQTDIRFINESESLLLQEDDLFFGTVAYVVGLASPILLSVLFVLFRFRRENKSENERLSERQRTAKKIAIRAFVTVNKLLSEGGEKEALKTLHTALQQFFMVKLNLSLSEISLQRISSGLKNKGASEGSISAFEVLWKNLESAQFAPVGSENLAPLVASAGQIISKINEELI